MHVATSSNLYSNYSAVVFYETTDFSTSFESKIRKFLTLLHEHLEKLGLRGPARYEVAEK